MSNPPPPLPVTSVEESRKLYIHHERAVKSIGILYYFAATMLGLFATTAAMTFERKEWYGPLIGGLCLLLAVIYFVVGRMIRRLNSKAVTPATILSAIGLLGFPLGTLINGYALYLIHCQKGQVVFSENYKAVVAATPHIKSKTSWFIWFLFILLFGSIALAFLGFLLSSKR